MAFSTPFTGQMSFPVACESLKDVAKIAGGKGITLFFVSKLTLKVGEQLCGHR